MRNKERDTKKKLHRHSLRGKESMWKRLNDKRVVHLATMQGCWQSPIVLPKLPPSMLHSRTSSSIISSFSSVSLLSAAAPLTCNCPPFQPLIGKASQSPPLPILEASSEREWMHSTALLHKNINWATESGNWLMCGCVQHGSLSHSASFTPLTLSSFSLSRWVWRHSVRLSVLAFVTSTSFFQTRGKWDLQTLIQWMVRISDYAFTSKDNLFAALSIHTEYLPLYK